MDEKIRDLLFEFVMEDKSVKKKAIKWLSESKELGCSYCKYLTKDCACNKNMTCEDGIRRYLEEYLEV